VRIRSQFRLAILGSLLVYKAVTATAQGPKDDPNEKLDREFQSAVAQYHAGHFAEAAAQLEILLPYAPKSFELQELLGLVYAAQSQDSKALRHLEIAANLKPDSATAHTNLAAALLHNGDLQPAGEQFRKAVALAPDDYDANHNLGEF
jgi:Flp pilus assembly protein TadD